MIQALTLFALVAIAIFCIEIVQCQIAYTYTDPVLTVKNLPYPAFTNTDTNIQFYQANFGPNFINNTQGYSFTGRVVTNYGGDGCTNWQPQAADGRPWNGTIAFVSRPGCSAILKVKMAEAVGVAAVVIVNCNTGPPSFCVAGRAVINALARSWSAFTSVTIPCAIISFEEGDPIVQVLSRNPQINITCSIPATGPLIDPSGNIRKALVTVAKAFVTVASDVMVGSMTTQDWATSTLDPCTMINKPFQFTCRAGRFTRFDNGFRPITGNIPSSFNDIPGLEMINLSSSAVTGVVPDIRNCTDLLALVTIKTPGITGMYKSVKTLQKLVSFAISGCSFTNIPTDFSELSNLAIFWVNRNYLSYVPPLNSFKLYSYDVSYNNIEAPVGNFSNSPLLSIINLSFNKFFSNDVTRSFENLQSLTSINLASNNISGNLPYFTNCIRLQTISVDFNQFQGAIPSTWNIPTHCSNNVSNLCSQDFECGPNSVCQSLLQVSASNNRLIGPIKFGSTSVTDLDLSFNEIEPTSTLWGNDRLASFWHIFKTQFPPTLVNINLQNNKLIGPWDQSGYAGIINKLGKINVANNQITILPTDLWGVTGVAPFRIIDASNNNLTGSIPIPTSSTLNTVEKLIFVGNPNLKSGTTSFPTWVQPSTTFVKVAGSPYVCPTLIGTGGLILELIVDPVFFSYAQCQCDRGFYQSPPNCLNIPSVVQMNSSVSFTDRTYGASRLMSGVDISWVLNPQSAYVPKAFNVYITIIRALFNEFTDMIEIYEGDESLTGTRIASFRGVDPIPTDKLSTNGPNTWTVLNSKATLVFRSKKLFGQHFEANYSISYICPKNYLFFDSTSKCQELFIPHSSIQITIYTVVSMFLLLLVTITYVIIKKRNSLIIRSSSFPFCLSMLIFMILLGLGSYFYAVYPDQGGYVCHIRPWLTACPLVGILSALLVKVDRIRRIFSSKELVVQAITNSQLAKTMAIMLSCEVALLLALSVSGLSTAKYELGTGSTNNQLVMICTDKGFQYQTWLIIQMIYIAAFLLVAVVIAWSVRKVPSAFNEAPSIASSLLSLTVLLIILIPLNFMVDDNPTALMLIRGLGQILVTIVLALFFFGPKLYLIIEGKDNDKSLSSIGSNSSNSSTTSASSASVNGTSSTNDDVIVLLMKSIKSTMEAVLQNSYDCNDLKCNVDNFERSYKSKNTNQICITVQQMIDMINSKS